MDMITGILAGIGVYCSYKLGQASIKTSIANAGIDTIVSRAKFPVGVAEKIEGHYYLYEKDSTNFLCQAPTLEEIPATLLANKNISLALLMCPEENADQIFWCINGKLKTVKP